MAVALASIRTDIWTTVYTYLKTTNPITAYNKIFSAYNSTLVSDKGYPLVIMFPPVVKVSKMTVTGNMNEAEGDMLIECYDVTSSACKTLADNVMAKMMEGRQTFAGVGLYKMNFEAGDVDMWDEGQKKIHRISFTVVFRYIDDANS